MIISRKETVWKKSRKFGDVKGGRTFPKIANRIFNRKHSLLKPNENDVLPIFIKDNPSKDFFFPVNENEILERINQFPIKHREQITHVWLRKVKKEDYENGDCFQGMFICGSGVNLIVLSAFPVNLQMCFGKKNQLKKRLNFIRNGRQRLVLMSKRIFGFCSGKQRK